MRLFLLSLVALALTSCGSNQTAQRKPVPPPGSDEHGSIPWNDPSQGPNPGGMLGGMMERR